MLRIESLWALQIIDSRGLPTVQAFLKTNLGVVSACVPSGASTGTHEAWEARDGGEGFCGKGVSKAIKSIEGEIADALIGEDVSNQEKIDSTLINLDGTTNKSRLGANAILAVSMAACKAGAKAQNIDVYQHLGHNANVLPVPLINMINGGAHGDTNCGIQEFMIIPKGFATFSLAIKASMEIFFYLKNILKEKGLSTNVGDEGGFAPNLNSNEEAIELLLFAIKKAGYKEGQEIFIGLDVAANEIYKKKRLCLTKT